MKHPQSLTVFFALAVLVCSASPASANGMMSWNFYEVVQDGPDVDLVLRFMESSIEAGDAYTIVRVETSEDEDDFQFEHFLFKNKVFTKQGADEVSEPGCHTVPWMSSESACEGSPDECSDCDGDGTNECSGHCGVAYYYELTDDCVPKGSHEYVISRAGTSSTDYKPWTVEKEPSDCGCGCSASGMAASGRWLPLIVMMAIGMVALLVSRLRR
ncbi:MAG: hypothetical protein JRF63_14660 [Deltaproteobacteria bacterium]|nr:hypothetical protein [Deltaproteobacteria bacterium]